MPACNLNVSLLQLPSTIRFGCHSLAPLSVLICLWCLCCSHMALFCFHYMVTHNQSGIGKGNVFHSVNHKFNHVAWSQASFTWPCEPVEIAEGWACLLNYHDLFSNTPLWNPPDGLRHVPNLSHRVVIRLYGSGISSLTKECHNPCLGIQPYELLRTVPHSEGRMKPARPDINSSYWSFLPSWQSRNLWMKKH